MNFLTIFFCNYHGWGILVGISFISSSRILLKKFIPSHVLLKNFTSWDVARNSFRFFVDLLFFSFFIFLFLKYLWKEYCYSFLEWLQQEFLQIFLQAAFRNAFLFMYLFFKGIIQDPTELHRLLGLQFLQRLSQTFLRSSIRISVKIFSTISPDFVQDFYTFLELLCFLRWISPYVVIHTYKEIIKKKTGIEEVA